MKHSLSISRRVLIRSSAFGVLATGFSSILFARSIFKTGLDEEPLPKNERYPSIRNEIVSEVVGVSHFNLDRLKELVDPRPELVNATWDWAFGDFESAIGAASHVGRKDIVDYLISKGATPTIFTFAMLAEYEMVKKMIEAKPGIQKNSGPHGISLLKHAEVALETEGVNKSNAEKLIGYLESLGDADGKKYLPVEDPEKEKYLGDYKYGEGNEEGFTIKLNKKNLLTLGRIGKNGGVLFRTGENEFTYNGAPSVIIRFVLENNKVISFTLNEPGLILKAVKV